MTATISYFVIASIAYVLATLFKNFTMGFWIAFTVHAVWIGFVNFSPEVTEWQALVFYYIAATIWAFLGFSFAKLWHHPPLLNGTYLSHAFYGFSAKPKPEADANGVARISSKMLFWLAWMVGAHIVFDLRVPGFPNPWPGVVATIAIIIGYCILFAILRNEHDIFKSTEKRRQAEVASYVFWFGLIHVIFAIWYFVAEAASSTTFFFDECWNFWFTLIIFGIGLLIAFLTSAGAEKAQLAEAHQPLKKAEDSP